MNLPKIILIHGNGGSTANDIWFPWVKKELEALGFPVIAKTFPDNDIARKAYWLSFLENTLQANENTILIGHSSGAEAAMRFAEKHKIFGTVLVSACYTDLGEESERISGYYDTPWKWEKIKQNQKWIVQFASTDDPFIPIEEAHYVHEKLNTDYHEYTDEGHFSRSRHSFQFPELVKAIKEKVDISS